MIDASGDIGVIGRPPNSAGWRVEVDALGRQPEKIDVKICHHFS